MKFKLNKAFLDANTLPISDPRYLKAKDIIDREYKEARTIEDKFMDKWLGHKYLHSIGEAYQIAQHLCESLGATYPITSVGEEKTIYYGGSYHHNSKIIYLQTNPIHLSSLLHELAHHFVFFGSRDLSAFTLLRTIFEKHHGRAFLLAEKLLHTHLLNLQDTYKEVFAQRHMLYYFSPLELLRLDERKRSTNKDDQIIYDTLMNAIMENK